VLGALIVVGIAPFDLSRNAASVETLAIAVVVDVLLAVLAILKGKPMMGMIGIFIPFVSLVAAIRLAAPRSPWARRFYKDKKLRRSEARFVRIDARRKRVVDAILGSPETPPVAKEQRVP
jgi:hypothetical protein